jgi:CoA-transferase family III
VFCVLLAAIAQVEPHIEFVANDKFSAPSGRSHRAGFLSCAGGAVLHHADGGLWRQGGRTWGPPFDGADASYFVGLNSGKQSVAIDLKTPTGLESCRQLAAQADIVLENFRPGTMNRLGLDYASLAGAASGGGCDSRSGSGGAAVRNAWMHQLRRAAVGADTEAVLKTMLG